MLSMNDSFICNVNTSIYKQCNKVDIYFLYSFSMDGQLEFIDTADMSLMNRQEHTKVTDINWDPTGRYVVSSLSFWTEKVQ